MYKYLYKSPIGDLIFISDGNYLTKIILNSELKEDNYLINNNLDIFKLCIKYFDMYFNCSLSKLPL